jgi:hypothetical protein
MDDLAFNSSRSNTSKQQIQPCYFEEKAMTEAETILKMIESVDPADPAKLDEIDARVKLYLLNVGECQKVITQGDSKIEVYDKTTRFSGFFLRRDTWSITDSMNDIYHPPYTRSRDALKAIRPDGWSTSIHNCITNRSDIQKWECQMDGWGNVDTKEFLKHIAFSGEQKSEELAELHAIIQAIEYERSGGE